jgi:predicted metalloenzyme YecM
LRFETANPVLIVSDDGSISKTDPHSLEMVVGASNQHTQQHLDLLLEKLINGYNSIIFGWQSPESYLSSLNIAEYLNIPLQKSLPLED